MAQSSMDLMTGRTEVNNRETEAFDVLHRRVYEAAIYLGVPEWFEIKYEGAERHIMGDHLRHSTGILWEFKDRGKIATANHLARVALDAVVLADIFGIGPKSDYSQFGAILVESAIEHDAGKILPDVLLIAEKKMVLMT